MMNRPMPAMVMVWMLAGSALVTPAIAQIAEPIPQRRDVLSRPMKAQPQATGMVPCPQYGPGFVRQPGSSTCIRIGGSIRGEVGIGGRRSQLKDRTGLGSQARIVLDSRTETGIGTLRMVFQGQARSGSGWQNRER